MAEFEAIHGEVEEVASDLLLLKYAQGFHGADMTVAALLSEAGRCKSDEVCPRPGDSALVVSGGAVSPELILFVGTPLLQDFGYDEMRRFARRAVEVIDERGLSIDTLTTTVHGVFYGLDYVEALQNLVRGFNEGLEGKAGSRVRRIRFVERSERRARVLQLKLTEFTTKLQAERPVGASAEGPEELSAQESLDPAEAGSPPVREAEVSEASSSEKEHLFVAMPFSEEFEDVYEFGIYAPVRRAGYICEKVDQSAFTGDILERIQIRIRTAKLVIADLSGARPNVYLEVGYAFGLGIPVVFVAREGEELHFDVRTHRCIFYRSIRQLARDLEALLRELP